MRPVIPFLDVAAANAEVRAQIDSALARVIDNSQFVLGPEVEAFERAFAPVADSRHAVGVGNGLDALTIALESAGVRPGDDVVVPAHTFIATWLAVHLLGARPSPAEPGAGGFNVTLESILPAVTKQTRAIVVVHLYGDVAEIEPIAEFARDRGIVLIEDAAQAHGARRCGRSAGGFGDAAAFSFYPAKNLGALGDGGAVTTSSSSIDTAARCLRNYGGIAKYEHRLAGRNSRMDALQAAVLSVKLERLESWNRRRREIAALYHNGLGDLEGLTLPPSVEGNEPAWHLYCVRSAKRDALAAGLADRGVGTLIHYPRAVYRTAPFAEFGPAQLSESDRLAAEVLSVPIGPHMTTSQVGQVIEAIREVWSSISTRPPGLSPRLRHG